MRTLSLLVFLLGAGIGQAQSQPSTQRLYCNLTLEYWGTRPSGSGYLDSIKPLVTGTCWALEVKGQPVLITAAHNLGLGPNFLLKHPPRAKLLAVHCDPVIGLLGQPVSRAGGADCTDWVRQHRPELAVEIIKRTDELAGFRVLPKRWVVELTLAWLTQNRRLVRDYERSEASAMAWGDIAQIRIIIRRLA